MFKQFTNCDLAMITIALDEEEQKNIRRGTWVHDIFLKRHIECEYVTLYKQLTDHEKKFLLNISACQNFNLMYFYRILKQQFRKKKSRFRIILRILPREKLFV